ncbi:MAG: 30S ribosome-binding factor RbfA [Clostridia bacterium]|jgi:ribosome-binding factor A|nr:30S ribosome-binding factor RbfA [Clostridia bacterium]
MANYRIRRINDEMTRELCRIIRNVKDPRVSGSLTTVTGCDVSPDLKYAKVFYSFLDDVEGEEAEMKRKEIKKGLESAKGFIRRELAMTLNLRITPELTFVPDTSVEYGAKISKILKTINEEEKND